jgi:hypothetical protein
MLRVIASTSPLLRDACISTLSLEQKEESPIATVYQKGNTIFLLLSSSISHDMTQWIADTFLPDRLYLPYTGYSVDVVHEIGDIIIPHTYLSYDATLEKTDLTQDNRDSFMMDARFVSTLEEGKDYYVEDYGLSIGGIVVGGSPSDPSDELASKMMTAYEADLYVTDSLRGVVDRIEEDEVTTLALFGIIRGKTHPKYSDLDPYALVVKNMMTTIRLLEDDGG